MPTINYLDGFDHRSISANDLGGIDGEGLFDTILNTPGATASGRNGGALVLTPAALTVEGVQKIWRGVDPAAGVHSFYYKFPTSLPAGSVFLFRERPNAGTTNQPYLRFNVSTSKFAIGFGSGGSFTDVGPTLVADQWYRVDIKIDMSANPWTLDCQIDGGTNVQVTTGQAASTLGFTEFGTDVTTDSTYTGNVDDWVRSTTTADYPIGAHKVLSVVPESDDTTASSYGTNVMEQGTGTDLSSGNQGWQYLDDWPVTGADLENDADHVTQTVVGASNQVTVNFQNTVETTIWGAVAVAHLKADAATADAATTQIKYSDATTVNIYSGDQSEVSGHYRTVLLDAAKVDTLTEFNGLQGVVGLCTNDAGDPEWGALMVQYAVPEAVVATPSLVYPRSFGYLRNR